MKETMLHHCKTNSTSSLFHKKLIIPMVPSIKGTCNRSSNMKICCLSNRESIHSTVSQFYWISSVKVVNVTELPCLLRQLIYKI